MRAYICFQHNDGWFFHLLSEDCQKPLTKWRAVESEEALLAMIGKMRGDVTETKDDLRRWSRGTVGVDLSDDDIPRSCIASADQSKHWPYGLRFDWRARLTSN